MQAGKIGRVSLCALIYSFAILTFILATSNRLVAQTQTGTISGTATDSTGGALVGANVTITNQGTNASQKTVTDAQGRYSVPQLPVGTYSVSVSMTGFQPVEHKDVVLSVGATPIVDFSLKVGNVSETVTVESEISQVDTQNATVSSLVSPEQVSDLPLNGRNYTQLIELSPGVQTFSNSPAGSNGPGGGGSSGAFYGNQSSYAFDGQRPEGQAFLLDNEDVRDFWEHGPGSSAIGSALGVDSLSEFQVLTNTYSAQFPGDGAVVNEASKSGTNDLHGSGYEFLRNSALDARNFFDFTPTGTANADGVPIVNYNPRPEFRQNQFGGSLGGPIKKNKLFFFANYEGFRNFLGTTVTSLVPEPYALANDELPCGLVGQGGTAASLPGSRVNTVSGVCNGITPPATGWPTVGTPGNPLEPEAPFGSGSSQAAAASAVAGILGLYPAPNSLAASADLGGFSPFTALNTTTESENYGLARVDYNLGTNDTLFGRYVIDRAQLDVPFAGSPVLADWPEVADTANQYVTVQERHILSATAVNEIRFDFTRTHEDANTTTTPLPLLQFVPGFPDGSISAGCPGCAPLGANTALPYDLVQNKFGGGDDLVWNHGSHSFRVGLAVARVQSNIYAPFVYGGTFAFFGEQSFLTGNPFLMLGTYPGHDDSKRYFREVDYQPYFQDDWKVNRRLTLTLGIRYDYATNPVGWPLTTIVNPPFADTTAYFTAPDGTKYATGFTPVSHVFSSNANAKNIEPRIGIAWDPFADHKTAVRAGFGIFHDPVAPRTYASDYYLAFPYASADFESFLQNIGFPNAFPGVIPGGPTDAISEFAGVNYQTDVSPYYMQYNLTIQREVAPGTVLSIGYIGSEGRHLFTEVDLNPPMCATSPANEAGGIYTTTGCSDPATSIFASPVFGGITNPRIDTTVNPLAPPIPGAAATYFGQLSTAVADQTSNYNSLQLSLNHQFSHNFNGQVSYTYSKCLATGSASSGLEQDVYEQADPYNRHYDYGLCSFDIRNNVVVNALYTLPFKGNRLVSGWQVGGIFTAHSGLPVTIQEGVDVAGLAAIQGDRPDYSGTCPGGRDQVLGKWYNWFNANCYVSQPFGTLGDVPRGSVEGANLVDLDFSVIKDTRVWEKLDVQFRGEFFNILNRANFAQPASIGVFTGAPTAAVLAPTGEPGDSGAIGGTFTPAREIQFALKLMF
jgi:hypothetical protein